MSTLVLNVSKGSWYVLPVASQSFKIDHDLIYFVDENNVHWNMYKICYLLIKLRLSLLSLELF